MNARTMKAGALPRILLVEDDPVSRAYLVEALAGAAEVVAVGGMEAALAAAGAGAAFALWLLDAHLADGDGIALLCRLRAQAPGTPALAHTADPDPAIALALRQAGFDDVLLKPIAVRALRQAVAAALGHGGSAIAEAAAPPWQPVLQQLFRAELPRQRDAVREALQRGRHADARACLHRLHGSCALVGERELARAVQALQAAPGSRSAWRTFERAVARMLRLQDAAEVGQQVP